MNRDAYRPLWVIVFVLAGFVALGGLSWLRGGGKELVPWRDDLSAGQAEAAKSGKRVFLYFTADWCGPCQQMRRTTWADPQVTSALTAGYVPVRIDIDRQAGLAQEYHVESIPWFAVLDEQGRVVRISSGAMGSEEFLAWLKG